MSGDEADAACVWTPLADGAALRVEIVGEAAGGPASGVNASAEVEAEWARLRAHNPRLFNGPVLSFLSVDNADAPRVVRVRRDEYRRLAVQPAVETGVVQLGVTGVMLAKDASGRRHALLGRRGRETRIFGGMWELGPSGGVDAPPVPAASMDWMDIWRVLLGEIREEVGLAVEPDPAPPVGLVSDRVGRSVEIVYTVEIVRPVEELIAGAEDGTGTSRWEYESVRWVATDELDAFAASEPVIPASIAIWHGLGLGSDGKGTR